MRYSDWNQKNRELYEATVNRANNTCTLNKYRTVYLQALHKKNMEKQLKITERGYAGHFCASSSCRFRRNTLIEYGDKRLVVSTVGNYNPPHANEVKQIGYERYYETMAFEANWEDPYWEADVQKQIDFQSEWCISKVTRETDSEADKMHEAVVKELCEQITNPCGKPHNNGEDTCNECLTIKEGI